MDSGWRWNLAVGPLALAAQRDRVVVAAAATFGGIDLINGGSIFAVCRRFAL
jgi:hypothetical protein